jgi:Holliday junction resolvase RusA-like endonuclease
MQEYIIQVHGEPRGQARARHRIVKTKTGKLFSQVYKDKKQRAEEDKLLTQIVNQAPEKPHTGFVGINITAIFSIPSSFSKAKTFAARTGQLHPMVKPDFDNIQKHVVDVMNGLYFKDDKQVCSATITKKYGEIPGLHISMLCEDLPG